MEGFPGIAARAVAAGAGARRWYVLWTQSHCEQLVHDQLAADGFELMLPKVETWSRRGGTRRLVPTPMFPGYLFLHHAIDKASYLAVRKARGLVRILGERWDRLEAVADAEVQAIHRLTESRLPVRGHPFLHVGHRVRISSGALEGIEGILLKDRPGRGLLVVTVELLQRSVAVEVDASAVEPL
jgi:transcription antitermination factor NusG